MQTCPKCGYHEVDWPRILSAGAFGSLFIAFIFTTDHAPMSLRVVGLSAVLMFLAADSWRGFRDNKNRREHLKVHLSPDQRVKSHFKPAAPGQ